MKIKIPFKTITINHLYYHRGNMKILTTEAKRLRKKIEEIVQKPHITLSAINFKEKEIKLKVLVEIHENWFCKNGSVKKKDLANREKFLIDSIFDALKIDDKFIFEHRMKKIQSEEEFAIIKIEKLKNNE